MAHCFCTIRWSPNLSRRTFFVCSCLYVCIFTFAFVHSLFIRACMSVFIITFLYSLLVHLHFYFINLSSCICKFSIWAFAFVYSLFEHLHLHYFLHSWWANLRRESFCLFVCSCCWQTNFSWLNFICTQAGAKKCQQLTYCYAKDCWKKDSSWYFSYIPTHSTLFVTKQGLSVDSKHCYRFMFFHECCSKAKGKRFVNDAGTLCCEDKRAIFTSFQVQCNSSSQSTSYVNKWICGFSRNFNTKAINVKLSKYPR